MRLRSSCSCPIARFIRDELGYNKSTLINVSLTCIQVNDRSWKPRAWMSTFIKTVDASTYNYSISGKKTFSIFKEIVCKYHLPFNQNASM